MQADPQSAKEGQASAKEEERVKDSQDALRIPLFFFHAGGRAVPELQPPEAPLLDHAAAERGRG